MDVVGESFSARQSGPKSGLIENLECHPVWDELSDRLSQSRSMCENLSLLAVA